MKKEDSLNMHSIDFYDYDELEKLKESRAKKFLQLYQKSAQGDENAKKALQKHKQVDQKIKAKACAAGFYCY